MGVQLDRDGDGERRRLKPGTDKNGFHPLTHTGEYDEEKDPIPSDKYHSSRPCV